MTTIHHTIHMAVQPQTLWNFLTNFDKDGNFRTWHPEDHVRFKVLKGNMGKKGSLFYLEEYLGKHRFFTLCKITDVRPLERISYAAAFPVSLLRFGEGYFAIEKHTKSEVTCIFHAEYGYSLPILGASLDWIINTFLIKKSDIEKHIEEEQQILKKLLEKQEKSSTS